MPSNKLKVASLFCGCGGSDLGMVGGFTYLGKEYEELPFEIVYAADFDKWAVDTYNKNFKHKAVCADVTEVDFEQIPDVDIMIGGFPCQSFSTVNPTKDTNDDRAKLYKQIVRFLNIKHPKYFICENVKGLMTLQGGNIINKIISEFCQCGYRVQFKLLKAVEYGVPQRRERVIIIGIRNDFVFNYEYPIPICTETEAIPLGAVIDRLDISEQKYYFSSKAVQGVKNAKNNMKRGLWQDLSKPCLTITSHLAKTSMNSRDPILLVDATSELYRRFTPREAARIQSFPENFILNESEPKSYKQIGNAVPPVLMWYVAKQLEKAIVSHGTLNVDEIKEYLGKNPEGAFCPIKEKKSGPIYKQLNFLDLFDQYELSPITQNFMAREDDEAEYEKISEKKLLDVDITKNLLICNVKKDNWEQYIDGSAKIYYTGKKFPSTVALNKLYYFMPYFSGKGIRDLYYIKIARLGYRKEGQKNEDKTDLRLVFEIEYLKQIFDDYKMVELEIWHTFKDTTMNGVLKL
ncbi:MAG: DNA (cytosine-5-)-methyltransferase [Bacteroidaceae bacterium]|nr:DNA (cytosine-5-)-methyltransferase [Bacteroidaceae bacterium]